jgi:hypothetical protein
MVGRIAVIHMLRRGIAIGDRVRGRASQPARAEHQKRLIGRQRTCDTLLTTAASIQGRNRSAARCPRPGPIPRRCSLGTTNKAAHPHTLPRLPQPRGLGGCGGKPKPHAQTSRPLAKSRRARRIRRRRSPENAARTLGHPRMLRPASHRVPTLSPTSDF